MAANFLGRDRRRRRRSTATCGRTASAAIGINHQRTTLRLRYVSHVFWAQQGATYGSHQTAPSIRYCDQSSLSPITETLAMAMAPAPPTIFAILSLFHKSLICAIDSLHDFTVNHLCNIRYLGPRRARSSFYQIDSI